MIQAPTEMIFDDDASNLILLKDLKLLVTSNLENLQEKSAQEQTKVKQEVLRKDEQSIEKEKKVCHTPIGIDSGDEIPDQRATPPLFQLDSDEEADKSQFELKKYKSNTRGKKPINFQITEKYTRTDIENQPKNRTPTKSPFKANLTGMAKRKASSPMKPSPPRKLSDIHTRHNTRTIQTITRRESID